jgi:hypothetical protein
MTSRIGIETNGTYIKYRCGYTGFWVIETSTGIRHFYFESDADAYVSCILGKELVNGIHGVETMN